MTIQFGRRGEWLQYRPAVWINEEQGIIARTADNRWFAYPFGPGQHGPFSSFDEAEQALTDERSVRFDMSRQG